MHIEETGITANGITFHLRLIERDASLPWLIMFHGFLGSGEQFCPAADALTAHVNLCLPDLTGFGKSDVPADISHYSAPSQVSTWHEILDSGLFGTSVILHGYSMGGRLALRLVTGMDTFKNGKLSGKISGLILESTTPGIRDESDRQARAKEEELMAQEIIDDLPRFLKKWKSHPVFRYGKTSALLDRIQSGTDPAGAAASITAFGSGTVRPVWDELEKIDIPVLILAGKSDLKYSAIAMETAKKVRNSTTEIIDGAGHRIHSDNPERYISTIKNWMQKIL